MNVTETVLEPAGDVPRYEQRYSVTLGRSVRMNFVRRSASILPPDGTVCHADNGPRTGTIARMATAIFRDGKWTNGKGRPIAFEPTHWTTMEGLGDA